MDVFSLMFQLTLITSLSFILTSLIMMWKHRVALKSIVTKKLQYRLTRSQTQIGHNGWFKSSFFAHGLTGSMMVSFIMLSLLNIPLGLLDSKPSSSVTLIFWSVILGYALSVFTWLTFIDFFKRWDGWLEKYPIEVKSLTEQYLLQKMIPKSTDPVHISSIHKKRL